MKVSVKAVTAELVQLLAVPASSSSSSSSASTVSPTERLQEPHSSAASIPKRDAASSHAARAADSGGDSDASDVDGELARRGSRKGFIAAALQWLQD